MKVGIVQKSQSREETLQKIIKNQELIIKDLENKVSNQSPSISPHQKAHFDNEIKKREIEIEQLQKKIRDI